MTEHTISGSIGAWEESKNPSGFGSASVAATNGYRETPTWSLSVAPAAKAPTGTSLDRTRSPPSRLDHGLASSDLRYL